MKDDGPAYFIVKTIHMHTDVSVEIVQSEMEASAGGDATILFNLHKIGEGPDSNQMTFSKKKLEALVEYLHANEDRFQVISYSSLFE